ncbi:hypothetical protein ACFVH6_39975 [Spirillospora sp. NPDC127200]
MATTSGDTPVTMRAARDRRDGPPRERPSAGDPDAERRAAERLLEAARTGVPTAPVRDLIGPGAVVTATVTGLGGVTAVLTDEERR